MVDVEHVFKPSLCDFMFEKGHLFEAKYIETVWNWRRGGEWGLTELQRSRYNYIFLNFILDELMPLHTYLYDFGTLEVNRSVYIH